MGLLDQLFPLMQSQESGNDPNAVSPKGAFGLMQLMPATAANPGFGVTPFNSQAPDLNKENQRVGRDYFSALYHKYGSVPTALMAYNWGPGNVKKWIASNGTMPVPKETQNYVAKIMAKFNPIGTAQAAEAPSGGTTSVAETFPNTTSVPETLTQPAPTQQPAAGVTPVSNNAGAAPMAAADNSGGLLAGLTNFLKGNPTADQPGDYSALGPTLLALGAGIAGGSGHGWGAGIGAGLSGANDVLQTRLMNSYRLAELANTLRHQGVTEEQGNEKIKERQSQLVGAANLIAATAPQYPDARKVLTEGNWSMPQFTKASNVIRQAILGAARITGENAQPLIDSMVPVYSEPKENAAAKLQAFESYMQNLSGEGGLIQTNPILAKTLPSFQKFSAPADTATTPPPAAGPQTAPRGAAPLQAGMSSPPAPTAVPVTDKQGNKLWYDPATNKRYPRQ